MDLYPYPAIDPHPNLHTLRGLAGIWMCGIRGTSLSSRKQTHKIIFIKVFQDSTGLSSTLETRHLYTQTDLWFRMGNLHSGSDHTEFHKGILKLILSNLTCGNSLTRNSIIKNCSLQKQKYLILSLESMRMISLE